MAKDLTPVPSTLSGTRPKGDGRLPPVGDLRLATLAPNASAGEVNVFPLALLGDFVREIQSAGGEELRQSWTLMPSVPALSIVEGLDRAFKPLPPMGTYGRVLPLPPFGGLRRGRCCEESWDDVIAPPKCGGVARSASTGSA